MDRPHCKLCGKAHWAHEPHVWSPTKDEELAARRRVAARKRASKWREEHKDEHRKRERERYHKRKEQKERWS